MRLPTVDDQPLHIPGTFLRPIPSTAALSVCLPDSRFPGLSSLSVCGSVLCSRTEQWRQREFKVGGDEPREPTVRLPD